MKKHTALLFGALLLLNILSCSGTSSKDSFPTLSRETQKSIIEDLSSSLNKMAQASIPVGGDTETIWAASEVDKLYKDLSKHDAPFMEQMSIIYHMNSHFAYGMNYAFSIFCMPNSPDVANLSLHSMEECDSLLQKAKSTKYSDMLTIAELSCLSYYYTQLHTTLYNRAYGNHEFIDEGLDWPIYSYELFYDAYNKESYTEDVLVKMFFILDAVTFFKTYSNYLLTLMTDNQVIEGLRPKIMEYAQYIDSIANPVFIALLYDEQRPFEMADSEFEDFMLKSTKIKTEMMNHMTEQFHLINEENLAKSTIN